MKDIKYIRAGGTALVINGAQNATAASKWSIMDIFWNETSNTMPRGLAKFSYSYPLAVLTRFCA